MPAASHLHDLLARSLDGCSLPGATADVFLDGVPAWSGAAGDLAKGTAMQPGAVFPAYSITKTFTSVCALRLAEAGLLALDDRVARWLPSLPFAEQVTLRALLGHTAGVFNYSALAIYDEAVRSHPTRPWSFDEFVEHTCSRPLDFEPGRGWSYSNTGYTLVKRILELTAELPFAALIEREVALPLGLVDTFALESARDMERVVPGYSRFFSADGGPRADVRPLYHPGWCGTGVVASTGPELCRFYEAVFDGRLLAQDSLRQMLTLVRVPGQYPPAVAPSYGLGITGDPESPLGAEFGHGGGGPGWNLRASHWPSLRGHRLTLVVLCNDDENHALPIVVALANAVAAGLSDPHAGA